MLLAECGTVMFKTVFLRLTNVAALAYNEITHIKKDCEGNKIYGAVCQRVGGRCKPALRCICIARSGVAALNACALGADARLRYRLRFCTKDG